MKINTIIHFIQDAFKSLKRNKTISIASVITVLITFFVLGIFLLMASNINEGIDNIQGKIELKVFLKDDIKLIDQREIEIRLRKIQGVKDLVYQSKQDEFNNVRSLTKDNDGLLKGYTLQNNPFNASFIVKLESPEYASAITSEVKNCQGVESIDNQQELVNKVIEVVKAIREIGFGLFAILAWVSVFLIVNTTKLTIYSRRLEISVMKFVGATDWFIRWPFVIEGMVIGVIGAILSCIMLYFLYNGLTQWITSQVPFVIGVHPMYIIETFLWEFVIAGIIVGVSSSMIALRKFLVV